jgi:hypothetical protein
VSGAQISRVLAGVDGVVHDADSSGDATALGARVDGAALALRRATYTVRAAVPTTPQPPVPGTSLLVAGVPGAGAWPRFFLAVTRPSADAVPQLSVLTQTGPREPYRLTASATLLPGTTLPRLAEDGGLATALPPGSAGKALLSPSDALAHYADVLTLGATSRYAASTEDDIFRRQVLSEQDDERTKVAQYETYTEAHAPRADAVWSLRTADGGSLVVGVLDGTRTFTPIGPGIVQDLPPEYAALAGRPDAPSGLQVATTEVVALHVPPAGSRDRLQLVGGNRGVVSVQVR